MEVFELRLKSIKNCTYREALVQSCWAEFSANRERIFQQIYLLNWNEYISRKTRGAKSDIGKIVFSNSFEAAILSVWKLVIDQRRSYTLQRLEKLIKSNIRFPDPHKKQLENELKGIDFDNKLNLIKNEFEKERHEIIVHSKEVKAGAFPIEPDEIARKVILSRALNVTCRRINQYYDIMKMRGNSAKVLYKRISRLRRLDNILASLVQVPNIESIDEFLYES